MCVCMHAFILLLIFSHQSSSDMVSEVSGRTMTSYNVSLSVPAVFPFDTPHHWPKWKCCFQQYRLACGLSRESEGHQVNTLLYYLDEEAKDILAPTNIGEEDRKKYDSILAKFDSFFSVRKM